MENYLGVQRAAFMPVPQKGKRNGRKEVVDSYPPSQKEYRLGVIGRGHFRGISRAGGQENVGKPDPNQRIGRREYTSKERFMHWKMFPLMCTEENGSV